jgi:signal transduction histidine kinase
VRHELFLAIKEALNNAVRHGQPSEVAFRLQLSGSRVEISVADNGKGFDPSCTSNGHGLTNLKTRLQNLGGRCEIESSGGQGTTVLMQLPLNLTV